MNSPQPPQPARSRVEIRRSSRRRRTVSAYREDDTIVVLVPARLSKSEEARLVADMVRRIEAKTVTPPDDDALFRRAQRLSTRYLGGLAQPDSVRWVTNQTSRWGSCTPLRGTVRLSHRLQGMPDYVVDYVLLHELAHLLSPDHSKSFWSLLSGYPHLERARGFLEGAAHGAGMTVTEDDADDGPADTGT